MAILCLGALLAGLVAASVMPFLPFACAVLAAIVLGAASTLIGGAPAVQTLLSAAALLFTSQIGYGLGVVGIALVVQALPVARRLKGDQQSAPSPQALRTGDEPR